jgi:hypothetical protein
MEIPPCPSGLKAVRLFEDGVYHILCAPKTVDDLEVEAQISNLVYGTAVVVLFSVCLLTTACLSTQSRRRRWRSRSRGASDEEFV